MAQKKTLDALQTAIRTKGYDWEAAETPQSLMSDEEQKSLLGLTVDEAELEATGEAIKGMEALAAFQASLAAPAAVDWRRKGGNWVTAVKDQGRCGSCVAFGTVAALESRIRIACQNVNMSIDLSEAHLFYCGCGNCCGTGWNFPPALNFCKSPGVAEESRFPYVPGNRPCPPGLTGYGKITAWTSVLSMADRKNILASKGPVVGGMAVYSDFFNYRSGVYKVTSTSLSGYHCICVVGYDDTQQCWICKNSWGTGWGEAGFFRIGYGQSKIDTNFAFYDMDAKCPVSPCVRYAAYLKNVLVVARRNANLRVCLKYYVCGTGSRPLCLAAVIAVVRNVLLILQRCPQYRRAFCAAL
ncbi:MAG TPA: C1 family peptidase [Sedimentisphaerales bacterium]|nr:C1 family peptidase [Sedimentisphaerales bacterium]